MMMAGLELHEAAASGDHDTLEDLLKSGKFDVNFKDEDFHNRTALHWACAKGYSECVRRLLDFGAKGTARTDQGWTPAHCAAETGRSAALRALHTYGVSVVKSDNYGDTPRRIATIYGHVDCIKFLLQAEAELAKRREEQKSEESESEEDGEEKTITLKSEQ